MAGRSCPRSFRCRPCLAMGTKAGGRPESRSAIPQPARPVPCPGSGSGFVVPAQAAGLSCTKCRRSAQYLDGYGAVIPICRHHGSFGSIRPESEEGSRCAFRGKAGAAPATVSSEPAPDHATGAARHREGRQGQRPASQETCRDDDDEPRAGCPGGAPGNAALSPQGSMRPGLPRPQQHGEQMQPSFTTRPAKAGAAVRSTARAAASRRQGRAR